jgi:hypothetical protein
MVFQELQRLPLWEHVAESGRFAEYAAHSTLQPWKLVGRAMLSCVSLLGSAAEVAQISNLGRTAAGSMPAVATGQGGVGQPIACEAGIALEAQVLMREASAAVRL